MSSCRKPWIKIQRQRVPRFHFHSATPMYREDSERAIFWGACCVKPHKPPSMLGTCRIRNRTFFLGGNDHFDPCPYVKILSSCIATWSCWMLRLVKKRPNSYGKGSPCLTYDFYILLYFVLEGAERTNKITLRESTMACWTIHHLVQ